MTKPSSKSVSDPLPLAVTVGEPAGIGPELVLMLALREWSFPWLAIGDAELLRSRARLLGLEVVVQTDVRRFVFTKGQLNVQHVAVAREVRPGHLDPRNAGAVLATLRAAVDGCLHGAFAGMVTAPVQKSVINDAGIPFTGHTEFLRETSGVEDVVMLLVARGLRVALATMHLPLRAVADAIHPALLRRRLRILHRDLVTRFRIPEPRILVAGLNPHAGEQGHLGREEIDVIAPVIAELRAEGLRVSGPLPADTLFTPRHLADADAIMAMYHDQGLPVLKYAGFGEAVNVTLGLPFVRTSVDHGTALDLAGRGVADPGSLAAALDLADGIVR